jgi:hypothetical protein
MKKMNNDEITNRLHKLRLIISRREEQFDQTQVLSP